MATPSGPVEYTPANSIYEDREAAYGDRIVPVYQDGREESPTRVLLRIVNSVLHGTACTMLVVTMAEVLEETDGVWSPSMRYVHQTHKKRTRCCWGRKRG